MADLSTLDATQPGANDAASGGDDAIRETRDAVKTSFGGTDAGSGSVQAEHYLRGFHKFPSGSTAARPAAGNAGRLYLNTEMGWVERDTGTAWVIVNAQQLYADTYNGVPFTTLTANFLSLAASTVTVPTGGRVLALGLVNTALSSSSVEVRLRSQGTFTLLTETVGDSSGISVLVAPVVYLDPAPTPGSVTYTLEARISNGATATADATLVIVVC